MLAPDFAAIFTVSRFIPPSTYILRSGYLYLRSDIFGIIFSINFYPPNPGLTVIIVT